ncbi:MAG: class I SAM-dependent methyltransferase [Candidatus Rokubacteria bacterium]|nr:class I SAM-dependent methyltransferase [Candidatus Rokubacteria bacterium]
MTADILTVVQGSALAAAIEAGDLAEQHRHAQHRALALELEQAHYQAALAARRYDAVDPDHLGLWLGLFRVVRRWLRPGCRVLDLGSSAGDCLRLLWTGVPGRLRPVRPALGVGLEPPSARSVLRAATALTPARLPILFTVAPLDAFPGQFDLILSHEVIYLLEDLEGTFAAARRALRPGGLFAAATAMYREHEYYRRWRPRLARHGIPVFDYSRATYVRALRRAGFRRVEVRPLRLSVGTYRRWRATRRPARSEWFASDADERRYFAEVGKLVFLGRRRGPT